MTTPETITFLVTVLVVVVGIAGFLAGRLFEKENK